MIKLVLLVDGREHAHLLAERVPAVGEQPTIEFEAMPDLSGMYEVARVEPRWTATRGHTNTSLALAGGMFEVFETEVAIHLRSLPT